MATSPLELILEDGSLADLPHIMGFFQRAAGRLHVQAAALFDLELALDEACTNVFEHAYPEKHGALRVELRSDGADLVMTLEDCGVPFDPGCVAVPNTEAPLCDRPIGGLGLFLIRQVMDDVQFAFDQGCNRMLMVKRGVLALPATEQAGDYRSPDDDEAIYS